MLYYKTIDQNTLELLKKLQSLSILSKMRLVGGTSLALQIGHRKSIDIDLFGKLNVEYDILNDELKNICQVEHSRHRSFENFISNLISGLIAYSFFPKKPAIRFDVENTNQIALF